MCFRLEVCFGALVLVDTVFLVFGGLTVGLHSHALGVTWFHLVSLGFTWCHSVSLGVTRFHFGVTWFHLVSLGFTRFHRSQVVVDSQSLLCLSDGVFFLRSEKKRPLGVTWIHFIAKKQVFQEVAD